MSVFEALVAAKRAGVKLTLDAPDGIILEVTPPARLPTEIVAQLLGVTPDLLRILQGRAGAPAAALPAPPRAIRGSA
jgi:hypothetical protein